MSDRTKVHGFMALKDEWPLCALSIFYALEHNLDDLLVLDNASNDATVAGLAALGRHFGDRLTIFRLEDLPFWQAEITSEVLHRIDAAADDWLYVLDADEFLLVEGRRSLGAVLDDLPTSVTSVRYERDDYVSHNDFDEADLDAYLQLNARSVPTTFIPSFHLKVQDIMDGFINYFDVPNASKVIVRQRAFGNLPIGGAHYFNPPDNVTPVERRVADLRMAHLPLLTQARLEARAMRRAPGFDGQTGNEGWQAKVFIGVADAGGLDEFWQRHSIGGGTQLAGSTPTIVTDDRFRQALRPTVEALRALFGDRLESPGMAALTAPSLPGSWVETIRARRVTHERVATASRAKSTSHQAMLDEQWARWEAALPDDASGVAAGTAHWRVQSRAVALRFRALRWLHRAARLLSRRRAPRGR